MRPIVITFDRAYVRAAAALVRSLARTRQGKPTKVIAIVDDIPGMCRSELCAVGDKAGLDLQFRDVVDACLGLPVSDHGSPTAYYRLLLGDMLPEFSSVVYVDCDAIFLRDPAELLVDAYDPYPVAAVQDLCNPTLGSPLGLPGYPVSQGDRDTPYFNSGLMVIDLDLWRSMGIGHKAIRFAIEYPQCVRFWDQDALNAVLRGNWHALDRRWNVVPLGELWTVAPFAYHGVRQVPRVQLDQLCHEAFLLHYASRLKPWMDGFPPGPSRDRWLEFDKPSAIRCCSGPGGLRQAAPL